MSLRRMRSPGRFTMVVIGVAWWLFVSCLVFVFCSGIVRIAWGQGIAAEHRVANQSAPNGRGICWWACADMLGREYGIIPLIGVRDRVLKTGVGSEQGTSPEDVRRWMEFLGLTYRLNPYGNKDPAFLTNALAQGLTPIVSLRLRSGTHAVLLSSISPEARDWQDAKGRKYHEQIVSFIDPNHHKSRCSHTWSWFYRTWTGRAYVFDPREQPAHLVQMGALRTMLAHNRRETYPVSVPPPPGPPVPQVEHLLYAIQAEKLKSNQEIHDGVARPLDTLLDRNYFAPRDYHSEFRARGGPGP